MPMKITTKLNTVLTPGIDTGSMNGSIRIMQKISMPCSPTSSSNSRSVMVSAVMDLAVAASVSDKVLLGA